MRVSVQGDQPRRAQQEVALCQCTLTSHSNVRTEANATQTDWTLSLVTHCLLLEPEGGPCELCLAVEMPTSSWPSRAAFLSPRASDTLGPAASSTINLAAQPGPATFLALQARGWRGNGVGDGESGSLLAWACPLAQQGLGLPVGLQPRGSLQVVGGEGVASGTLAVAGHTATLTLAVAVRHSKATLQAQLRHTLPVLQALPQETSLTIQLGQEAGHRLGLELQAGACKLQGVGELQLDRGLWWRVLAQSSCEALQLSMDLHDGGSGFGHSGCVTAGPTSLNYTGRCSHFPVHLELSGQNEDDSVALMQAGSPGKARFSTKLQMHSKAPSPLPPEQRAAQGTCPPVSGLGQVH
ncbi:uncharacterized protein LOC118933653 [Manis pentadactyla]|uniref:uncharacterized protein LOC118933653 n=1 Tax=Manis pentadactyla TaxID=143292 RepID=UPI00255CF373|nr:uncharacterized protein LOC118933653 [Manis pentadactyla]